MVQPISQKQSLRFSQFCQHLDKIKLNVNSLGDTGDYKQLKLVLHLGHSWLRSC